MTPENTLSSVTDIPKKTPLLIYCNIPLSPGPNVIPKELIITNKKLYFACAHNSIFIARNLRASNLDPPSPKSIFPNINTVNAAELFYA